MEENAKKAIKGEIEETILEGGVKEIIIREGEARPIRLPKQINIVGQIDSIFRFLDKRKGVYEEIDANILVDRRELRMILTLNDRSNAPDTVKGFIELNPEFEAFLINTGETRTTHELAEFIKLNRVFFDKKETAMKLVSELTHFKAKVDKELERSDDGKGNRRMLQGQVVQSNIPEGFYIEIPIFLGAEKTRIFVEVNIDADDFSCSLISPDAVDYQKEVRDGLIDEQIKQIELLCPGIVIIEV